MRLSVGVPYSSHIYCGKLADDPIHSGRSLFTVRVGHNSFWTFSRLTRRPNCANPDSVMPPLCLLTWIYPNKFLTQFERTAQDFSKLCLRWWSLCGEDVVGSLLDAVEIGQDRVKACNCTIEKRGAENPDIFLLDRILAHDAPHRSHLSPTFSGLFIIIGLCNWKSSTLARRSKGECSADRIAHTPLTCAAWCESYSSVLLTI